MATSTANLTTSERREAWIEDHGDVYGVHLTQAHKPGRRDIMGWIATATRDGEPVGADTSWHSSITTAAADGELLMDKLIRDDADRAMSDD